MENVKSNILKYRAYQFSLKIIRFVETFPEGRIYWIFEDQLLRAATSIGANIVEAQAASSKREFIKFYEISLKSALETEYWLCLLRDSKLVEKEKVDILLNEAVELAKMLGSALLTLKGKKNI